MRITSKGRYGLKAMMELAHNYPERGLVKNREIAENQNIPLKYLEHIINTLKKNRLVTSVRGADGGYRLAKPPMEITVFEILQALEGDLSIIEKNDETWGRDQGFFWQDLDQKIRTMLEIPLAEFLESKRAAGEDLMFYI